MWLSNPAVKDFAFRSGDTKLSPIQAVVRSWTLDSAFFSSPFAQTTKCEALTLRLVTRVLDSVTWHGAYGHLALEAHWIVHHPSESESRRSRRTRPPRFRSLSIHRTGVVPVS